MEFAMSGQEKRKRCKKWVTTRGYFRDIMVSCLKPRAYSRRLPTSSSSEGIRGRPLGRAVANYQGVAQEAEQLILNQRVGGASPSVLVRGVEQSGSSSGSYPEGHWFKSSLRNVGDYL